LVRALFVILAPLIADQRAKKNAPDQWIYFEWLARQAVRYMDRKPWWESRSWEILKSKSASLPDPSAMAAKQRLGGQTQHRGGNQPSTGRTGHLRGGRGGG
jgi:hypothetical protein